MATYFCIIIKDNYEDGRPNSTQAKQQRDHKRLARISKGTINTTKCISSLQMTFNKSSTRDLISILQLTLQEWGIQLD
ncbi:1625_t:CDS:2 [Entrophospora sp. SA101]|nr:1625_t:CDS:2 [Entrophospora sp. SA101]